MWSKKVRDGMFVDDFIHISGDRVKVRLGVLPQNELQYWKDNPRIYSIVHAEKQTLDQDDIQLELLKREHVKSLIQEIRYHGGLMEPLILKDVTFEVIEGNSRLAAIRFLSQNDPVRFSSPKCLILPKDISDDKIYSYLNQQHIQGKTEWSAYEAAGVVFRLREAGKSWQALNGQMNMSKAKAMQMYETYKFMVVHGEEKPERYSYYQVYLSNRKAKAKRELDSRMDSRVVEEIRKGEVTAQEFRSMLPMVCDNPKALNKFLSGRNSLLAVHDNLERDGKTKSLVVRLKRIQQQLAAMEKDEFDRLDAKASNLAQLSLKRIKTQVSNLTTKVFGLNNN